MRNALIAGAVLSSIIGVLFVSSFASELAQLWQGAPHDVDSLVFVLLYYWPMFIYALLAFAPVIILIRVRQIEMRRWRLAVVAAAELITIVAFLAMLLAKRFSPP